MMSNEMQTERKEKARRLRSSGLTYRQIAKEVGASLETLHRWCKDIPPQTDKQTLKSSSETPNRMFGEPFTVPKQTGESKHTLLRVGVPRLAFGFYSFFSFWWF